MIDENLSPKVARAVLAITAARSGFEVGHVRDHHGPGTDDTVWIRAFAEADGNVIISGDPNILQHWPNLVAYIESGLISFFPPKAFDRFQGYAKAAFLLRWWPCIIEKAKISERGDCWRMPLTWSPDVQKFEELRDPRIETREGQEKLGIQPKATIHQFKPR